MSRRQGIAGHGCMIPTLAEAPHIAFPRLDAETFRTARAGPLAWWLRHGPSISPVAPRGHDCHFSRHQTFVRHVESSRVKKR
jgi:hypothetical protein